MSVLIFEQLTRTELAEAAATAVALLPLGATEQHGPHLPMGTDSFIATAIVDKALGKIDPLVTVVRLPVLSVGSSQHHLHFGALSYSPDLYLRMLGEYIDSLARCGFHRILMFNAHGGNDQIMRVAASDGVLRHNMVIAACSWWSMGEPFALDHAGQLETSIVMRARPELVREVSNAPAEQPSSTAIFDNPPAPGVTVARSGEWEAIGGFTQGAQWASALTGAQVIKDRGAVLRKILEQVAHTQVRLPNAGGAEA